jgi:YggT family protein
LLYPIYHLIDTLLWLYIVVLIVSAVLSWLVAFNIVNTRNRAVFLVGDFCFRLTEPALRPIRRMLPSLGGIDISPIILILLLQLLREYLPMMLAW